MRVLAFVLLLTPTLLAAQGKPRARELGIPIGGTPGRWDAITDVAGVEVGQTTLISGGGKLVRGKGPVRTGVTAVLPRGRFSPDPVFAAWSSLNGNGEMTGTHWMDESGFLWGPVVITNTQSVGVVRDAVIDWAVRKGWDHFLFALPVVAETWDGGLNDIDGFHVRSEHVFRTLDQAASGPVSEGNVGGGTGMVCNEFKGGIGTASRMLSGEVGGYTVGVLVQCNYGRRDRLMVSGVPVGAEIPDLLPCYLHGSPAAGGEDAQTCPKGVSPRPPGAGSIIVIIATDAPLLPHQLRRLSTRAGLAVGRMGGLGEDSSGDLFLAFSTANPGAAANSGVISLRMLPNDRINPLFEAVVQATEEAILNSMLAAETMTGADDYRVYALPADRLMEAMRKYGRVR